MINVGVIGLGSFGKKRAHAVNLSENGKLIGIADIDFDKACNVAVELDSKGFNVEDLLSHGEIEVVIVAAPNKFHLPLTVAALENGKHVLCEKPLSRNSTEASEMVNAAVKAGRLLKTGSNHRYFQSVKKAHEIFEKGIIGDIVSFNGRIGNNGERLNNSWFTVKDISGGGTLLDNGCHLLDIARWFMGDFIYGTGTTTNAYWTKFPVEDTATGVFLNKNGKIATINSSWRQLSGYFYFEINGTDGYITVDGRFDTHGGDNIYWQSSKSRKTIHSLNFGHITPTSYVDELEDFFDNILKGAEPEPSGKDGLEVIKMVEAVYKSKDNNIKI